VENKLYSIPTGFLTQQSEAFAGMFSLDNCSEGLSDDSPIVLEGYKSTDFDNLLKVLIPRPLAPSPPNLSKNEWISTLKLATMWQMDEIRKVSISRLSEMNIPAIEKVTLAREYHVAKRLREGIATLASDTCAVKIEAIAEVLGRETTARIFAIRDTANKPTPGTNEPTFKLSQLTCVACGASPSTPGPTCCNGRYITGYARGYNLKSGMDGSVPGPSIEVVKKTVLELFGEELELLEKY
ncbi:hypothetical protein BKA70DRAFT_1280249, partial [Coprinopsis sp. MPI-PUGE-AT-0042]